MGHYARNPKSRRFEYEVEPGTHVVLALPALPALPAKTLCQFPFYRLSTMQVFIDFFFQRVNLTLAGLADENLS